MNLLRIYAKRYLKLLPNIPTHPHPYIRFYTLKL